MNMHIFIYVVVSMLDRFVHSLNVIRDLYCKSQQIIFQIAEFCKRLRQKQFDLVEWLAKANKKRAICQTCRLHSIKILYCRYIRVHKYVCLSI